jgi:Pyruvate kinase, barrel domain
MTLFCTLYCLPQGPEVRSGDLPQPIHLPAGQEFTFTIKRGVGTETCVSVNYDDFVNDVEVGDMILVDGKWNIKEFCIYMCSLFMFVPCLDPLRFNSP